MNSYHRHVDAPKTSAGFLAATLGELSPHWLELRCDLARRAKVVCTPLRLMAAKQGDRGTLRDV